MTAKVNVSIRESARARYLSGFQRCPRVHGVFGECRGRDQVSIGPVAQLGERLVCIQEVVGSNPVGSTTEPSRVEPSSGSLSETGAYSSVWLERTPDKREVGGSNPPRPTSSELVIDWKAGSKGRDLS